MQLSGFEVSRVGLGWEVEDRHHVKDVETLNQVCGTWGRKEEEEFQKHFRTVDQIKCGLPDIEEN